MMMMSVTVIPDVEGEKMFEVNEVVKCRYPFTLHTANGVVVAPYTYRKGNDAYYVKMMDGEYKGETLLLVSGILSAK